MSPASARVMNEGMVSESDVQVPVNLENPRI